MCFQWSYCLIHPIYCAINELTFYLTFGSVIYDLSSECSKCVLMQDNHLLFDLAMYGIL